MRWSGATGAIARCKRVSTGCGRKRRSVPAWPWICGVKPTPKAANKPSPHSIVHGLDKPGVFTTVSIFLHFYAIAKLTVCPSVASRNLLLYQSLPIIIPYRYALLRRRKDDTGVGTASRGIVA